MSDTSEYTIVDDSSSSPSGQVQVSAPIPEPSPRSGGSYKIMGNSVQEISEVLQMIRNSIIGTYEATLDSARNDGYSEEDAKHFAFVSADELVEVLEVLGETVALLPEQGHVETAELLVQILDEASSMLAAAVGENEGEDEDEYEDEPYEKLSAMREILSHKCQAQLYASQSWCDPAQAAALHEPVVQQAFSYALDAQLDEDQDTARFSADMLQALLPVYIRSLAAIYGSASGVSSEYVQYGKYVLSELDNGNGGAKEEEGAKSKTTWYQTLSGLPGQVRGWYSSFCTSQGQHPSLTIINGRTLRSYKTAKSRRKGTGEKSR